MSLIFRSNELSLIQSWFSIGLTQTYFNTKVDYYKLVFYNLFNFKGCLLKTRLLLDILPRSILGLREMIVSIKSVHYTQDEPTPVRHRMRYWTTDCNTDSQYSTAASFCKSGTRRIHRWWWMMAGLYKGWDYITPNQTGLKN